MIATEMHVDATTLQEETLIRSDIRNVAIIAHVDHGKTTLVDGMLRQTRVFRDNQAVMERVMDSNELERERGITILAKNTGIEYRGITINIVDTPGHADFGGEVERIMHMVDGVLLLVDAVEGPMPQTRFVLRKALERGLRAIVVVNKIDRPAARPDYVVNATFDLFIDLGATDEQAEFPVIYTHALAGRAGLRPDELAPNLEPLFDAIVNYLPPPRVDPTGPTQLLVATIEYSPYVGKIAIGRLQSGTIRAGQPIVRITPQGEQELAKVTQVYVFRNLQRVAVDEVSAGNIVAVAGIEQVGIGDTLADPADPRPLPPISVEEPTVRMTFSVNDSPFAGREGQYLTSRQVRARLFSELERNVSLRVEETERANEFIVSGRGELHLAILIETMRREGYEFAVSRPEVIFKQGDEGLLEPIEELFVEVAQEHLGAVQEMLGRRRAQMQNIHYGEDGAVYCTYLAPTRGLLGFRQPFLTATRGTGVYHTLFYGYAPYVGEIDTQKNGKLVALETGVVSSYALTNLQQRGGFIVKPGDEVYAGQVVGEHIREEELVVNVCKSKQLTNFREKPSGTNEMLNAPRELTLDDAIQFLDNDDLLEVTPASLRVRKKILNHDQRQRARKAQKG
ncbi:MULTISPECIES: translational GTPase TypA [Caldilinea]|jgi:GTP-binding protein|uniref:Large ribosomal subunit assembly factor BipA n=1 Tax=Caldilinea aerophila (strain DSM 14535 / JCM 11387 / NBRC 104270 / STL-6-O1) TaxID=926550 RepID=I0I8B8_CALAS|nr:MULTISPECIES: translational GTPase TypA [Caldilinea]BAM01506.1 GTP-binding protein TypA [Caldilinea aerophila DSM 14535 = NBRC 104270]GIV72845.1 MAG: GTP-binding protein [Caldilinea sp.]